MFIDIFASGSKGNSYRISDGETAILLECGISFKEIQQKTCFEISKLAGCLISHEHS